MTKQNVLEIHLFKKLQKIFPNESLSGWLLPCAAVPGQMLAGLPFCSSSFGTMKTEELQGSPTSSPLVSFLKLHLELCLCWKTLPPPSCSGLYVSRSDVVCVLSRSTQVNFVIALIFSQVDLEAGAHESALGSAVTQLGCWENRQAVEHVAAVRN